MWSFSFSAVYKSVFIINLAPAMEVENGERAYTAAHTNNAEAALGAPRWSRRAR